MRETWELQKKLHNEMETPAMRKIQAVFDGGYLAARATGAGGGGCMLFYIKPANRRELERKVAGLKRHVPNIKIMPFKFDYNGIDLIRK
jgi:D-glycero-alpha-D-manno-heptose-7-phosphate kinase